MSRDGSERRNAGPSCKPRRSTRLWSGRIRRAPVQAREERPASVFFVDVSEQLDTPTVIFAGKLIARVGLATNKPAEFIILRISQDTRALEAEPDPRA